MHHWGICGIFVTSLVGGVAVLVSDTTVGVGLIVGSFIWLGTAYGGLWLYSKLRKRGKHLPKMHLPNRSSLIRAIGDLQQSASTLLQRQQSLTQTNQRSPHLVHVDEMNAVNEAQSRYDSAYSTLQKERLVAGPSFHNPIDELITFFDSEIETKTSLVSGNENIRNSFQRAAERAIQLIDNIASG